MAAAKKKSARKKSSSSTKKKEVTLPSPPEEVDSASSSSEVEEDDMKLTLEALDAMSSDDDGSDDANDDGNNNNSESGDGDDDDGDGEYSAEADALRTLISDGKFDDLLQNAGKVKNHQGKKEHDKKNDSAAAEGKKKKNDDDDDESSSKSGSEYDSDSSSNSNDDDESGVYEEAEVNDGEYQELDITNKEGGEGLDEDVRYWMDDPTASNKEGDDEVEKYASSDSDDEDLAKKNKSTSTSATTTPPASIALATAIQSANRNLPWEETFTIVAPTPLPFGPPPPSTSSSIIGKKRKLNEEEDDDGAEAEEEYVDIHDDLKREVAFYDNALESVTLAREQCERSGIPFTRPDDFFAEMVKSDEHMAKIKDRLIFETKKMEAVERRKSNKEQTAMAKERHAHRIAEKSKAKKAHMSALDDWKKNAERGRSGLGGKVNDWQDDEDQLHGMGGGGGMNKKRMAVNKRYGFGGKTGRFKQNEKRTLNDMSGFKPSGGFGGIGQKSQGGGGGGKKDGKKRIGKRARDAGKR